ncbi:hypothetical protein PNEG_02694 [Pneumocystis murina B123]|uniref:Peripheral subunit-binding (PSBD) domain-containing protein n=1 Tax=Pneumocystis murina (strain B123) TaxID=1069680 RepID=M7NNS6_PNEMU|nr:hypothetical protein PNEG_02694 [Pneumocystis murina B123]EMR08912.1 hypothetical protein PNEG_02694 [Pneumocystis murina B123]
MFSNFSSFFLRFIDKDSLKIIQTKGNNISFERWYHKYLFSPEKRYKSSKNSLNTFFKNVLIRNFNSDKSIFRKGFFRIKLSKTLMYFNTLNHGILPIISMPEYMYIKNGMDKFQFQKKRSIFTDRINRNDILVKDIMEDRLKNPVTISSPAVLSLIKHYNITNPFEIKTTGPRGRLLKGDILAHVGAINKDFPLKLVKIIEEKEKLDLSNLKIKPKQPIENSFISIIIPVCLKSLLSMKESINEKLNIKIELSDLINKAIYKGSQKVPSIFLKKPSRQEILFSNVLEEIPKYYNCINVNINNEDFQIDYIKDKKTNVLWASPKIIRWFYIY